MQSFFSPCKKKQTNSQHCSFFHVKRCTTDTLVCLPHTPTLACFSYHGHAHSATIGSRLSPRQCHSSSSPADCRTCQLTSQLFLLQISALQLDHAAYSFISSTQLLLSISTNSETLQASNHADRVSSRHHQLWTCACMNDLLTRQAALPCSHAPHVNSIFVAYKRPRQGTKRGLAGK